MSLNSDLISDSNSSPSRPDRFDSSIMAIDSNEDLNSGLWSFLFKPKLYFEVLIGSIPILASQVQSAVLAFISYIFLNKYDSVEMSTALGVYSNFTMFFYELMISSVEEKVGITLGRAYGSKNNDKFKVMTICGILSMTLVLILFSIPCFVSAGVFLDYLGLDDEVLAYTEKMLLYSIPSLVMRSVSSMLLNIGYCQKISMPYSVGSVVTFATNLGLLYFFVAYKDYECIGVVYARNIAEAIGLIIRLLTVLLFTDKSYIGLPRSMRKVFSKLKEYIRDFLIFAVAEYCETGGYQVAVIYMARLDDLEGLNAYVAEDNVVSLFIMISISIATSYSVRLNSHLIRKQFHRARQLYIVVLSWTFVFTSTIGCAVYYFRYEIAGFYTTDDLVLENLAAILQIYAFMVPFDSGFEVVTNTLRSLGKTKWLVSTSIILLILMNTILSYIVGVWMDMGVQSFAGVYSMLFVSAWTLLYVINAKTKWDKADLDITIIG